jgi:hypothetical protein
MTEIINLETIEDMKAKMEEADHNRGHRFIGTEKIPALYATENIKINDKQIAVHYFTGDLDWFVFEYEPTTGTAFALTFNRLTGEEDFGYVNLFDLGRTTIQARVGIAGGWETIFELLVERDCYWTPCTVEASRAAR